MINNSIFIFILLFLLHLSTQQSITYDFIVQRNNSNIASMIFLSLLSTEDFCIGTPYQCQKVQFDPGSSLTLILNKDSPAASKDDYAVYDKNKSSTYEARPRPSEHFSSQKGIAAIASFDSIKFGPYQTNEGHFFLAKDWIGELHYSNIGLSCNLIDPSYHYFISELLTKHFINKLQYTIIFNDDNTKGKIIFGSINSTINDFKQYNLNKEFEIKSSDYFVVNYYKLHQLTINNTALFSRPMQITFDEAFGFIQMPSNFNNKIKEHIVKLLECTIEYYKPIRRDVRNTLYFYYVCSKESIKLNEFSDSIFDFDEVKLILRKEDLFIDYNSTTAMLSIIFREDFDAPKWIIGQPILKNYVLTRDFDANTCIFHSKISKFKHKRIVLYGGLIVLYGGLIVLLSIGLILLMIIMQTKSLLKRNSK